MTKYDYRNFPIEHIISQPLIAVARAQNMLAKEQVDLLFEMCFHKENGILTPVMITMTIRNCFLDNPATKGDAANIRQIESTFGVPLISILPINSLSIDNARFNFGIEVLSGFYLEPATGSRQLNTGETKEPQRFQLSGKTRTGKAIVPDLSEEVVPYFEPSVINVTVQVANIPLSGGIRDILDLYSKNIDLKKCTD